MRNIRQNLFFALAYNTIGIPIAAGLLYPVLGIRLSPIIAAAAMALSSLSVVANANRLRRWRPTPLPAAGPVNVTPQVQTGPAPGETRDRAMATARPDTSVEHQEAPMQHHDQHTPSPDAVDPVCGMTISPATAAASREVGGTTYYFCSAHCANTFDADPDRYTSIPG
jgi:Cu+-exporting ATPase